MVPLRWVCTTNQPVTWIPKLICWPKESGEFNWTWLCWGIDLFLEVYTYLSHRIDISKTIFMGICNIMGTFTWASGVEQECSLLGEPVASRTTARLPLAPVNRPSICTGRDKLGLPLGTVHVCLYLVQDCLVIGCILEAWLPCVIAHKLVVSPRQHMDYHSIYFV